MRDALLLALALAAPAPRHRPPAPAQLVPGAYTFSWGGQTYPATLHAGGGYDCTFGGTRWSGSWHWCARTRTLRVTERCETSTAPLGMDWSAVLDARLSGTARWGEDAATAFSARRAR